MTAQAARRQAATDARQNGRRQMRLIGLVVQSEALGMKEGGVACGGVGMAVVVNSCDMRIGGNISHRSRDCSRDHAAHCGILAETATEAPLCRQAGRRNIELRNDLNRNIVGLVHRPGSEAQVDQTLLGLSHE
jgi:hypothetical protein